MYWVVGCTTQNLKKKITKNKKRPKEQKIKLTTVSTMVNIKSRIMTRIQQCRQGAAMVVDESLPISVCLTIVRYPLLVPDTCVLTGFVRHSVLNDLSGSVQWEENARRLICLNQPTGN